jgi:autotransporter-associated beta strand protein
LLALPFALQGQISITGSAPVVETFNSLSGVSLPSGWKMSAAGAGGSANWADAGNFTTVSTVHSSNGTFPAAGRIHWTGDNGSGSTPSIGFYTSAGYGSPNAILAQYRNDTAALITSLQVVYRAQRRITRADSSPSGSPTFQFAYSLDGTTWTPVASADMGAWNSFFNSQLPGTGTVLTSNPITANLTGLQVPIGGSIYLRWVVNTLHSGVHWGFGLDNVSAQVTGSAPAQLHWVGDDTTRGGAGTWTATGGTAWAQIDADGGAGVEWNAALTARFGGTMASTVVVAGSVQANLGLTFLTSGSSLSGGTILLGGATRALNTITADDVTVTIGTLLAGTAGVTKAGTGSVIFDAVMSYTGGTDITSGVLVVTEMGALGGGDVFVGGGASLLLSGNQAIANNAALRLSPGAQVVLGGAPGSEETVGALVLNGVSQADGTYGATGSGAQFVNDTFFSGSGLLRVGVPPATFAAWAAARALSGNPAGDFDNDGVPDGVEYVLGTDPRVRGAVPLVFSRSAGGDLILTFPRSDESETADVRVQVEGGTDLLAGWPLIFQIGANTAASTAGVVVTENGTEPDTIVVTIPNQGTGRLFGQLKVTVTAP